MRTSLARSIGRPKRSVKMTKPDKPPLFTLPRTEVRLSFGVLRRNFSGRINSATDFVWSKLHPGRQMSSGGLAPDEPWRPTAARIDVLLPKAAPDMFADPRELLRTFELALPDSQKDLLIVLKLAVDEDLPLHVSWEQARDFYRQAFLPHRLAAAIVLHDPTRAGGRSPNPPHLHLLVPALTIGAGGWRGPTELARDDGHDFLVQKWRELRAAD